MLSIKECIRFEWKSVSLPIHRKEELEYALKHVSYFDSPFSSSYEERKAYYGEDWHHYTGEALEILCTLPGTFLPEQKEALLQEYSELIEYGNTMLDKIEQMNAPINAILNHFMCIPLSQAEHQIRLFGYNREVLDVHDCNEEQRQLILYCYEVRLKEHEIKKANNYLNSLEEKYGSDILYQSIQKYKVDMCLQELKKQIDKMPVLKHRL